MSGRSVPEQSLDLTRLGQAFLAGFPDRIGQLRSDRKRVLLASGSEAQLLDTVSHSTQFVLALDTHQLEDKAARIRSFLEMKAADLPTQTTVRHRFVEGRVQAFREVCVGAIVLTSHNIPVDPVLAGELLLRSTETDPQQALQPDNSASQLMSRIRFYGRAQPCPIRSWADVLPALCVGRSSLRALRQIDLVSALQQQLPWSIL